MPALLICLNNFLGRMEYNPVFTKTTQGGAKKCAESKWLAPNEVNPNVCPVRLFKKIKSKRGPNITTDRMFLTCNPSWNNSESSYWYKNMPIGRNEISKWTKEAAAKIGLDTKHCKITNHSNRATAVSNLIKNKAQEQQLIKLTGHGSVSSIKPYLQMDTEHHLSVINKLRRNESNVEPQPGTSKTNLNKGLESTNVENVISGEKETPTIYQNCNFFINCTNVTKN